MKTSLVLIASFALLFCSGCNKSASQVDAKSAGKTCFTCNGTGQFTCNAGCKEGLIDCPGPCLKLSKGKWEHLQVAGHKPDELWQKFHYTDGKNWSAWNHHHTGEVIQMQNGKPVNIGKCTTCLGKAKITCTACAGTGLATCQMCEGRTVVPNDWTAFNNPKLKNPPRTIRFKDGRTIVGKIEMRLGSTVSIRTEDGTLSHVDVKDIADDGSNQ